MPEPDLSETVKRLRGHLEESFLKAKRFIYQDMLYERCKRCGGEWKPCADCDSSGWTSRSINTEDEMSL